MRLISALLASAFALGASAGQAQLLPAGDFAARDGRPGPGKHWRLSDAQGQALAARLNDVAAQTPIVIDYEHQTMLAEKNGQPAPAAGWMKSFEWRPGQGLFSQVEWTARARAQIDAGEYKFISPVIAYDKASGEIRGVVNAALVNLPAILGMAPVMASLAHQFHPDEPENEMNIALLVAALSLAATATETEVTTAIKSLVDENAALKAKPAIPPGLVTALGLANDADEGTAVAALAALKGAKDSDKTTLATLGTEVQTLRSQILDRDLNEALEGAIAARKITPAQRASLADIGKRDFAWLKGHLAALQAIPGLEGQSGNDEREPPPDKTDARDLANRAIAYQQAQLKGGVEINTAQAVAAVAAAAK